MVGRSKHILLAPALCAIKALIDIVAVDFECSTNYLDDDNITVSFVTKQCLLTLYNEGSIGDTD